MNALINENDVTAEHQWPHWFMEKNLQGTVRELNLTALFPDDG